MPLVTVLSRPNGEPMATTCWPTSRSADVPRVAGCEAALAVGLDDGEVGDRVAAEDLGLRVAAVVERDGDRPAVGRGLHDVVVGEDLAVAADDDAGARTGLASTGDVDLGDGRQQLLGHLLDLPGWCRAGVGSGVERADDAVVVAPDRVVGRGAADARAGGEDDESEGAGERRRRARVAVACRRRLVVDGQHDRWLTVVVVGGRRRLRSTSATRASTRLGRRSTGRCGSTSAGRVAGALRPARLRSVSARIGRRRFSDRRRSARASGVGSALATAGCTAGRRRDHSGRSCLQILPHG